MTGPTLDPLFFLKRISLGRPASRDGISIIKNTHRNQPRLTSDPKEFAPIWLQQDMGVLRNTTEATMFRNLCWNWKLSINAGWKPEIYPLPSERMVLAFLFSKFLSSRKWHVTLLPGQQGLHLYKSRGGGVEKFRGKNVEFRTNFEFNEIRQKSSWQHQKHNNDPSSWCVRGCKFLVNITTTGVMNVAFIGVRTFHLATKKRHILHGVWRSNLGIERDFSWCLNVNGGMV